MFRKHNEAGRNGFTLVEILLALGIMGIIAVFAIALSSSVRNAAKVGETERRLEETAVKARAVYRNSEALPAATTLVEEPSGTSRGLPVGATELNMEQKYRYDAWGKPVRYYLGANILGLTVDGKQVFAAVVSDGPDQTPNTTISGTTLNTAGDDIVMPVNVSQEAAEIALEELKALQAKVQALDAVYEGIDNGGTVGTVDESGCVAATPNSLATGCPPTNGLTNDPNCGTATLDAIENGAAYGCAHGGSALDVMVQDIYAMSGNFLTDPWGHAYAWGCAAGSGCLYNYANTDQRYHKFFSLGPNNTAGDADDIIP